MFVHISPEPDAVGETISTLKFAERVATVELGAARVNKDSADVKELKEQVLNTLIIYHSSQFLFLLLKTLNYYFRLLVLRQLWQGKRENQRRCNIHFPTALKDTEQKPVIYHLFILTSRLVIC